MCWDKLLLVRGLNTPFGFTCDFVTFMPRPLRRHKESSLFADSFIAVSFAASSQ